MESDRPVSLPDSLRRQLCEFRARLIARELVRISMRSVCVFVFSFFVLFISDRIWNTPDVVVVGVVFFAVSWILLEYLFLFARCLRRYGRFQDLANIVEKRNPCLGDKLLGAIELTDETEPDLSSQALRNAAIKQVSEECSLFHFRACLPPFLSIPALIFPVLAMGGLIFTVVFMPESAANSWSRFISPLHPPSRIVFTRFLPLPSEVAVPLGEHSNLIFQLAPDSSRCPQTVHFSLDGDDSRQVEINPVFCSYTVPLPPIKQRTLLSFSAGDFSHSLTLAPKPRPELEHARARIKYPTYTGIAEVEEDLKAGTITLLKGASVQICARAATPLQKAILSRAGISSPVPCDGEIAFVPWMKVEDSLLEWHLNFSDKEGLKNAHPIALSLIGIDDQMPQLRLSARQDTRFLLESSFLEFDASVSDDYGVEEMGIEWFTEDDMPPKEGGGKELRKSDRRIVLSKGGQTDKALQSRFVFQAKSLGITPRRIVLRLFAKDYCPDHREVYSRPLVIRILSLTEHAQMIRSCMDRVTSELDEIAKSMDSADDEIQVLSELPDGELTSPASTESLKKLTDNALSNKEKINSLIRFSQEVFRESVANTEIDPDGMKQFARALRSLESLPGGSLQRAREEFSDAIPSRDAAERKCHISKAGQEYGNASDILKQGIAQLDKSAKEMESATFVARLLQAAEKEKSIVRSLSASLPEVAGEFQFDIPPSAQKDMSSLAVLQQAVYRDISWISDDLKFYKGRTKIPIYTDLSNRIEESLILEKLLESVDSIHQGHPGKAIDQMSVISASLERWAKSLDDYKKNVAPPESAALEENKRPMEKEMSDSDFELMLKMMRMIQSQQNIRARTRGTPASAVGKIKLLSIEQDELQADVFDLMSEQTNKKMIDLLERCRDAMNDAIDLLDKKETGGLTLAAQTEVMEIISQAAKQHNSMPNGKTKPESREMMNIMQQILRLNTDESRHKGSLSGKYSPNNENSSFFEEKQGSPLSKDKRTVPAATGTGTVQTPEEFKQMIDAYNKTLQDLVDS